MLGTRRARRTYSPVPLMEAAGPCCRLYPYSFNPFLSRGIWTPFPFLPPGSHEGW